jgi:hypothetical protein
MGMEILMTPPPYVPMRVLRIVTYHIFALPAITEHDDKNLKREGKR